MILKLNNYSFIATPTYWDWTVVDVNMSDWFHEWKLKWSKTFRSNRIWCERWSENYLIGKANQLFLWSRSIIFIFFLFHILSNLVNRIFSKQGLCGKVGNHFPIGRKLWYIADSFYVWQLTLYHMLIFHSVVE